MGALRYGSQEPTFKKVGDYSYSDGEEAISLFNGYGATFYPCQEYELELFLARNDDGTCAATTISISKPRQNGKSHGARYYALWMACIEGKRVLFSAHHGKTVRKMFRMLCDTITAEPDFANELKPHGQGIYKAAGSEGIYFVNEGCIEFQTRTASAGRGDTYDVIIVDEAQEFTEDQRDAIKPTSLASDSGDPQMIYLGTPPGPKCAGTVFRSMHDKAHEGAGIAWWLEWGAEEIPDMSKTEDVLDLAYKTNPALGYRVREHVMREAIEDATSPDGFAREYLGWWASASSARAISPKLWESTAINADEVPETGKKTFGVKLSPDGECVALAVCIMPDEGPAHIELVDAAPLSAGLRWLIDYLTEPKRVDSTAAVAIDGKNGADALADALQEQYPKQALPIPGTKGIVASSSMLQEALTDGALTHWGNEAQAQLDHSATSPKRPIGKDGGWGFGGEFSAPIEAAALAHWAAKTTKRDPEGGCMLL